MNKIIKKAIFLIIFTGHASWAYAGKVTVVQCERNTNGWPWFHSHNSNDAIKLAAYSSKQITERNGTATLSCITTKCFVRGRYHIPAMGEYAWSPSVLADNHSTRWFYDGKMNDKPGGLCPPDTAKPIQTVTIQQKSNGRYLDAHENANDNSVVTRSRQNNNSQRWIVKKVKADPSRGKDAYYTFQQKSNGRYLDAYQTGNDNSAVTRSWRNNFTQGWTVKKVKDNIYTIQQLNNGRYLDAHENANDNSAVTRGRQNNDSQRWIINPPLPQ